MKDTPEFILKKQLEIIRSKPIEARVQMTFDMIQFVHDMADARIKRKMPDISPRDLVAKRFAEIYERDFSPEELERIVHHLKNAT
jgi:hypothetical protein